LPDLHQSLIVADENIKRMPAPEWRRADSALAQPTLDSLRQLQPMRSLGPAILAVAAVVGGCGGSNSTTAHSPNSGAAPTRARVALYAHEVNLRPSDLPDAPPSGAEGEDTSGEATAAATPCGGSVLGEPGTIHSARFARGLETDPDNPPPVEILSSTVRIEGSAAVAARDVAADRTTDVRDCIGRFLLEARGPRGPLIRKSDIVSVRPEPLPAGHNSFDLTVTFRTIYLQAKPGRHRSRFGTRPSNIEVVQDILGFASGRAQITLTDIHEAGHHPAAKEQRLLSLLYTRAEAHNP